MKTALLVLAALILFAGPIQLAIAAETREGPLEVEIPPQTLALALNEFAEQYGLQIVYLPATVAGRSSQGFSGRGSAEEVLSALLAGTGLEWRVQNELTFLIAVRESRPATEGADRVATEIVTHSPLFMGEVVVTAARREEPGIDVPASVSAYNHTFIEDRSIDTVEQLVGLTPGANFTAPTSFGDDNRFTIRGIAANFGNATVGVYVDDVALTVNEGGNEPNIRLFDVERVEILRGPQGTLYGAGAMGGAIKYITKKPDLSQTEGQLRLEGAKLSAGEHDVALDAAISVPIVEDRLAVRFAGSFVDGGGYVDIPNAIGGPIEDSNSRQIRALRGTLRWQPVERLTLDLGVFVDQRRFRGEAATYLRSTSTPVDDFRTAPPMGGERDFEQLSLNLAFDLGWAELRSITSRFDSSDDFLVLTEPGNSVSVHLNFLNDTRTSSQELRLLSAPTGRWSWVAGIYYQDVETADDRALAIPDLGIADLSFTSEVIDRRQLSAYGEATYQIAEKWAATAGLRYFTEDVATFVSSSQMGGPPGVIEGDDEFSAATPRFVLSYRPSDRIRAYASVSEGFRGGGINELGAVLPGVPIGYEPDSLRAYEVGVKTTTGKLDLTAALYYNDWEDVQTLFLNRGVGTHIINGGKAHTAGLELTLDYEVVRGLRIGANAAVGEAEYDEPFFTGYRTIEAGDRIPNTPEWNFALLLSYDRPLSRDSILSIRVDGSYSGDVVNIAQSDFTERTENWNALIGVVRPSYELSAFVRNITDESSFFTEGLSGLLGPHRYRPRSFGLQFVKRF
ncbi:MAG: TonB-dependent receptor [Gammaproteobacteria bacterium]|nr:TonB-dependent receptor [Gammaproteobacteria bacterium]